MTHGALEGCDPQPLARPLGAGRGISFVGAPSRFSTRAAPARRVVRMSDATSDAVAQRSTAAGRGTRRRTGRGASSTGASGSSAKAAASPAVEREALVISHWFDAGEHGEPYAATIRLTGRRHVLEHNGGVIDEAYTRQTDEGTIGRRVRIIPAFVEGASVAALALAERLEGGAL